MIKKGGGPLEVNPPATTGCWAFTPAIGCTGVSTTVDRWSGLAPVCGNNHSVVDHQVGPLQVDGSPGTGTTQLVGGVLVAT